MRNGEIWVYVYRTSNLFPHFFVENALKWGLVKLNQKWIFWCKIHWLIGSRGSTSHIRWLFFVVVKSNCFGTRSKMAPCKQRKSKLSLLIGLKWCLVCLTSEGWNLLTIILYSTVVMCVMAHSDFIFLNYVFKLHFGLLCYGWLLLIERCCTSYLYWSELCCSSLLNDLLK